MKHLPLWACLLLLLSACQNSREFVWPAAEQLPLGSSTPQQIMDSYGEPYTREELSMTEAGFDQTKTGSPVNLRIVRLNYRYRDPLEMAMGAGNSAKERRISFDFANNTLFSYVFYSSFRADRTLLDEKKAAKLENGKTTRAEILDLFGKPAGRAIFPAAPPDSETYIYVHYQIGLLWQISKRLELVIGDDDLLRDYKLQSETIPVIRPINVPVYIPVR